MLRSRNLAGADAGNPRERWVTTQGGTLRAPSPGRGGVPWALRRRQRSSCAQALAHSSAAPLSRASRRSSSAVSRSVPSPTSATTVAARTASSSRSSRVSRCRSGSGAAARRGPRRCSTWFHSSWTSGVAMRSSLVVRRASGSRGARLGRNRPRSPHPRCNSARAPSEAGGTCRVHHVPRAEAGPRTGRGRSPPGGVPPVRWSPLPRPGEPRPAITGRDVPGLGSAKCGEAAAPPRPEDHTMRSARRPTLSALAGATVLATCALTGGAAVAATPTGPAPAATSPTAQTVVPKIGTPFPYVGLVRAAGADRYETAAVISQGSFAPSVGSTVFVTSGEAPADALTAGPAAASLDAPLLLTRADALPAATAAELERLTPATVYVVGGSDRVSATTLAAIAAAAPGATVERIAGQDRYDTAVDVAEKFFPAADGVVLTRGDTFPDALSGGAAAAATGVPLMITEPGALPAPVAAWLASRTFEASLVVGGPTSVSDTVAAALAARTGDPTASTRVAGADRYDTAAAVATEVFPDAVTAVIATGDNFPDALAGVPAAALNAAPMLLLPQQCTPVSVYDYLVGSDVSAEIVLGGPTSVTAEALTTNCA
ncbi:putative cell wall binding repeat 2-containing protein [Kineococcus radiotolerans SRS30216 = ATCC BAA-149]|uniref:Cell wall binding repeat 2-containing protein n=2 Tax=Kineococcus radiotolerans TaxID=131568 RepID=A6W8Y0_KINRD|nr:putative cell wall binding repeat 2-containing protein [Kineococcus radiotolerans SRS30216 = ATCC BAA-149]